MNAEVGERFRVGEVAGRLGVSARTVKYYEELGLVEPEERTAGGFRLYGEREVRRLERILRLKGMGFSLAAVREILSVRDAAKEAAKSAVLAEVVERLEEQERRIGSKVRAMREDLLRAEVLREELRRDVALCKERIRQVEQGTRTG